MIETLTHFCLVFPFYTTWKHQKTFGFLVFSGGYKMATLAKNGLMKLHLSDLIFLIERMSYLVLLIYFRSLFTFCYPWKHKETRGALMFSVGIKRRIGPEWLNLFQDNVFLCFYAVAYCSGNVCTKIEFIKIKGNIKCFLNSI